jgi:hypothetical protein
MPQIEDFGQNDVKVSTYVANMGDRMAAARPPRTSKESRVPSSH